MAVIHRIIVFVAFFSLLSCTPESLEETTQLNIFNDQNLESQILSIMNTHRESIGLSALTFNEIVYNYANDHNDYMILKGSLSHDNFNSRASKISHEANAKQVGENIATGYTSAEGVFNGWINSLEHKSNIENDFTQTAISVRKNGNGDFYYTQIFIK